MFKRVERKPGQHALTRPRRQAESHGLVVPGRIRLADKMEPHVPALEALGYAEEFGFVGNCQDDGMGPRNSGASLA